MSIIRDLKIDILLDEKNSEIDLFNEITKGLKFVKLNVYNDDLSEFIFYKDTDWIFYYDTISNQFYCNSIEYWKKFQYKEYSTIREITYFLINDFLNKRNEMIIKDLESDDISDCIDQHIEFILDKMLFKIRSDTNSG